MEKYREKCRIFDTVRSFKKACNFFLGIIKSGDISSKTITWPIPKTECQKWAQIERLGFQDPGLFRE